MNAILKVFPHKINVGIVASVRYSTTTPNFVEVSFNLLDKCWRREGLMCFSMLSICNIV